MTSTLKSALDDVLQHAVDDPPGIPGVVAMVTDRHGNLYEQARGSRRLGDPTPMTLDTTFALYSATKAITATAALQLVERGQLDLDAPAKEYAPRIGSLQVVESFDDAGNATLRPPRSPVTTRQLLTHTAGFGYDFFNETSKRLARANRQAGVSPTSSASLETPLLFEPGTQWEYGTGIDWVGQVIEGITGQRLGDVVRSGIFEPLGMHDTSFEPDERLRSRHAALHARHPDGHLEARDDPPAAAPEVHFGGHGLHGTVADYMRFIRMWLNDGAGPQGQVLRPDTVRMACQRQLADPLQVRALRGVIKSVSNDFEFFPGQRKSWSMAFMINEEAAPTGRPAGSLGWCGLANLYYWIDRQNGIGGFWATQILPFGDSASLAGYLAFETATYQALTGGSRGT